MGEATSVQCVRSNRSGESILRESYRCKEAVDVFRFHPSQGFKETCTRHMYWHSPGDGLVKQCCGLLWLTHPQSTLIVFETTHSSSKNTTEIMPKDRNKNHSSLGKNQNLVLWIRTSISFQTNRRDSRDLLGTPLVQAGFWMLVARYALQLYYKVPVLVLNCPAIQLFSLSRKPSRNTFVEQPDTINLVSASAHWVCARQSTL